MEKETKKYYKIAWDNSVKIKHAIKKIELIKSDLEKGKQHREETGENWWNENLLIIRLNEIEKILYEEKPSDEYINTNI